MIVETAKHRLAGKRFILTARRKTDFCYFLPDDRTLIVIAPKDGNGFAVGRHDHAGAEAQMVQIVASSVRPGTLAVMLDVEKARRSSNRKMNGTPVR